jgi:hypothetical protein
VSEQATARLVETPPTDTPERHSYRKLGLAGWNALWVLLIAIHFFPIRFTSLRELLLLTLFGLWLGALILFWKRKAVRVACVGIGLVVAGFTLLPGRPDSTKALRDEYVRSLQTFEGTTYVWGGETHYGIDCSGLVRTGLIDADVRRGITTLNPGLIREGVRLWWNDCSAKELGEGYKGKTVLITETPGINQLDHGLLKPGDIAVTDGGMHTMAYIGENNWIEADPGEWKVIRQKAPAPNFVWFNMKMRILRWKALL